MSDLHLYRVTVESYPTPDGKPFTVTDPQIFVEGIEAWANPDGENGYPAWFPADLESWLITDDGGYGGPQYPTNTGHLIREAEIFVPVFNRRHWLSRTAANKYAQRFRDWGCKVTVDKSKPIEFEETND